MNTQTKFKEREGGEQWKFEFGNGYGASVITGDIAYGGCNGLFEVAVLENGSLCYSTPITDDVIGYLTEDGVMDVLDRIEQLPAVQRFAGL